MYTAQISARLNRACMANGELKSALRGIGLVHIWHRDPKTTDMDQVNVVARSSDSTEELANWNTALAARWSQKSNVVIAIT